MFIGVCGPAGEAEINGAIVEMLTRLRPCGLRRGERIPLRGNSPETSVIRRIRSQCRIQCTSAVITSRSPPVVHSIVHCDRSLRP